MILAHPSSWHYENFQYVSPPNFLWCSENAEQTSPPCTGAKMPTKKSVIPAANMHLPSSSCLTCLSNTSTIYFYDAFKMSSKNSSAPTPSLKTQLQHGDEEVKELTYLRKPLFCHHRLAKYLPNPVPKVDQGLLTITKLILIIFWISSKKIESNSSHMWAAVAKKYNQ